MDFQRDWSPFQKEIDFFVLVVDQTVKISLVVGMHYPISVLGWGLSSMLAGQMRDHGLEKQTGVAAKVSIGRDHT